MTIGVQGQSTKQAKRSTRLMAVGTSVGSAARPRADQGSADPAPTATNTKAEIVAWLLRHGVSFSEAALANMTKDELLDIVRDLLDTP